MACSTKIHPYIACYLTQSNKDSQKNLVPIELKAGQKQMYQIIVTGGVALSLTCLTQKIYWAQVEPMAAYRGCINNLDYLSIHNVLFPQVHPEHLCNIWWGLVWRPGLALKQHSQQGMSRWGLCCESTPSGRTKTLSFLPPGSTMLNL